MISGNSNKILRVILGNSSMSSDFGLGLLRIWGGVPDDEPAPMKNDLMGSGIVILTAT